MIITLIVVGLLIVGIVCLIVGDKIPKFYDLVLGFGLILTILFSITSFCVVIGIIDVQINEDICYQNKLYEREMLEYRIDSKEDDIIGNEMLYNDIVEFNNSLRSVKKYANNPFTSWFYPEDVAMIDYIDISCD